MKVHFIGIGGIGVSGLAQYYLSNGYKVSGSDLTSSETTDYLKKKGIRVFIGNHKAKNLENDVDLVIFSPAVKPENPELKKAHKLKLKNKNLKILSYPQALGELTKKFFTIAVAGTHGKSTTTAMVSLILIRAGFNPTVIIGTKLKEFNNSNFHQGGKPKFKPSFFKNKNYPKFLNDNLRFLVIEADEWNASFLNYWPKIIILTSIEKEHLDYYRNLNHILRTYKNFIKHLPKNGILIANNDDKNVRKLLNCYTSKLLEVKKYSLKQKETKKLKDILKVPGQHNVYNALAALTTARVLKITDKVSFKTLSEYQGAWRRFEIKQLQASGFKFQVVSDYAHHPTEILATLRSAREKFKKEKIWCVFQPHQVLRTFYLFSDFVNCFKKSLDEGLVDKLILTKIYEVAGREKKYKIKENLAKKIKKELKEYKKLIYIDNLVKIREFILKNLKEINVLIIMGAGDIYNLYYLIKEFDKRSKEKK